MSSSHNNLSNHPASFGLIVVAALLCALAPVSDAQPHASPDVLTIRRDAWLRILRAEDKRLVDSALLELLGDRDAQTRRRAALALGRIGESSAIAPLASLLANDEHMSVRGAAAFAIGEIEALEGVAALRTALHRAEEAEHVRARATEALGKIAAALAPEKQVDQLRVIQSEITKVLSDEAARSHQARRELALAAITAALRARMSGAALTISEFLASDDARARRCGQHAGAIARARGHLKARSCARR
ncbi:MAG: HEAT repeat domain-containing protein [Pyrinomonadaceae bacterium]